MTGLFVWISLTALSWNYFIICLSEIGIHLDLIDHLHGGILLHFQNMSDNLKHVLILTEPSFHLFFFSDISKCIFTHII